eukprot:2640772-Prymnesium_polylepis.1
MAEAHGCTPVHQTEHTPEKGNALQACVATILGTPLSDVPNFIAQPEGYWQSMLVHAATLGLGMVKVQLADGRLQFPSQPGTLCVLRGTSPRGPHGHVVVAVVANDGTTLSPVHDPHPDGGFLSGAGEWAAMYTCPRPASTATSTGATASS